MLRRVGVQCTAMCRGVQWTSVTWCGANQYKVAYGGVMFCNGNFMVLQYHALQAGATRMNYNATHCNATHFDKSTIILIIIVQNSLIFITMQSARKISDFRSSFAYEV